MDTINVVVRTVIFTTLVLWWPEGAVVAFSTAQIGAVVIYAASYYMYFRNYMIKRKTNSGALNKSTKKLNCQNTLDDDFPFISMKQFFPHKLENEVCF